MRAGGLLAFLLLLAQGIHAQGPKAEARLDTTILRVGDPALLTLTLQYDAALTPDLPDLSQLLQRFSPRCRGWEQRESTADRLVVQECQLRLYELGSHQVPAIEVAFIDAKGDTLLRSSQTLELEVVSARREGEDQPRDIKPPLVIAGVVPLWWLAVVLVLVLLVILCYWLWRRRSVSTAPSQPPPAPIDFAAEFTRIAGLGLLERGDSKMYYSLLSENLRRFLEETLGVEAMEQTTSELAYALNQAEIDAQLTRQIVEYMATADLVKFARFHPDLDAARYAPKAGLVLLREVEKVIATREEEAEAHDEHPV